MTGRVRPRTSGAPGSWRAFTVAAGVLALLATGSPLWAADSTPVAAFYAGRTIRIVVASEPGGGLDAYARLVARHLGPHVPGRPTVIVENMPGAGGHLVLSRLAHTLPRDGSVVGAIHGSVVLSQLLGGPGIAFDFGALEYLGVPVTDSFVLVVHRRTGVTRIGDVLGRGRPPVTVGVIPRSATEHGAQLVRHLLGASLRVVSGYTSSAQVRLALDAGEVDGYLTTWQALRLTGRQELDAGEWRVILQLGDGPAPDHGHDVPRFLDLLTDEADRGLVRAGFIFPNQYARQYVLPPGTPPDRVAALRSAFDATMAAGDFRAEAARLRLEVEPIGGEQVRQAMLKTLGLPVEVRERLRAIVQPR